MYTISQLYFDIKLYMLRTDFLSIIRRLFTVFTATGICLTSYVDNLLARSLADRQHNQYVELNIKIKMRNSESCWLLAFGHPRCVCNNEVEYNECQNTTKFIGQVIAVVLIKQHVSAYSEAIIRFTMLAIGDY